MLTDFRSISPSDTLGDVIQLILAGSQQDFPVLEGGQVVGVLTRGDLLVGLAKQGQSVRVEDVMIRQFKTAEASEPLDQAFSRLQTSPCKTMPVTRFGDLVGLVTLENVGEYVMIKSALEEKRVR
jgi:predicted transcriptional regulator